MKMATVKIMTMIYEEYFEENLEWGTGDDSGGLRERRMQRKYYLVYKKRQIVVCVCTISIRTSDIDTPLMRGTVITLLA